MEPELFNWTSLERYGQAFLRHPGEAPGRVHIKVDTGMHRLGFQPSQGAEVAEALRAYPGLEVVSVIISPLPKTPAGRLHAPAVRGL